MPLQERIRSLRKERGFSQEALAEALGVSRQAVTKWEDGSALPSTANLLALADFFGVPLEDFVRPAAQEENAQGNGAEASNAETFPRKSHRKTTVRIAWCIFSLSILVLLTLFLLFPGAFDLGTHIPETLPDGAKVIGHADGPTAIFVTWSYAPARIFAVLFLSFAGFVSSLTFLLTLRHYERKKQE